MDYTQTERRTSMNYNMTALIKDPKTAEGMNSDIFIRLKVSFTHNEDDYGNGYWVMIKGDEGFENFYDLRYDKDFHANHKMAWLTEWAENYWNGENGAYILKGVKISRKEQES